MDFEYLKFSTSDNIALVEINRPEKRNALNDIIIRELTELFNHISKNQNIKAAILTGRGEAFCSGLDLEYIQKLSNLTITENQEDSKNLMRMYQTIYECRKPIIAMVNGPAIAGGCGLATVCDFIIASRDSGKFGYPEVHIGFIPAIVLIYLLKRISEGQARDLVISGKIISSEEAKQIGLINEIVDSSQLKDFTFSFTEKILENNSVNAMGICKDLFVSYSNMDTKQALDYASNINAISRLTEDFKKGINAYLKKGEIKWK
jgi:methylglutaconyl-CoA hydratase